MKMDDMRDDTPQGPDTAQLRAGTWAMLGLLLGAAPSAATLARLGAVERAGEVSDDPLARAWSQLSQAAATASMEALAREYQDVFIGVGGGEVTPYASWYLTGTLMDRPLVQLRDDLVALGIEVADGCSEPEDHVAALCEIMALVVQDEAVDLDWQKALFQRHVGGWMMRFFADLEQAGNARFYRAVAALGRAFVEAERKFYAMSA